MTTDKKPIPSLMQLEASALRLISERILSKGGKMPSEKVVRMAAKAMASRAMREAKQKLLSPALAGHSGATQPIPLTVGQQPEPTNAPQIDSSVPTGGDGQEADPTRICWTQLLRDETPSADEPPLPLPPPPDMSSMEDWFFKDEGSGE